MDQEAPIAETPTPQPEPEAAKTVAAMAKAASLEPWQLAQVCAITKFQPHECIDQKAFDAAVATLKTLKLGG